MSISFHCRTCGKKYKVDDKLAGKRVACKGCGASLLVVSDDELKIAPDAEATAPPFEHGLVSDPSDSPAASDEPDFDTLAAQAEAEMSRRPTSRTAARAPARESGRSPAAGPSCPECGSAMLKGTRLCVNCGYDTSTGKQLESATGSDDASPRLGGRNRSRPLRNPGGSQGGGISRIGVALSLIGVASNVLPLTGLQLKLLMDLGAAAPMVGCGLGLLGAVFFLLSRNIGSAVISGSLVMGAFAVCMVLDPYSSYRAQEQAAQASAQKQQAIAADTSQVDTAMEEWKKRNESRSEELRQLQEKRVEETRRRQQELAAQNPAMTGSTPAIALVPEHIPAPPPRELPSDPIERELFLLQQGTRAERVAAGTRLLANPPKEKLEEIAAVFRALTSEQDVALRRLAIPGMLLVGSDLNTPALITLLNDSSAEIRTAAIKVLAQLKDDRAVEPLLARLGADTDEVVAALKPFSDRVEPALITKLKESNDKEARLAALKGLAVFGTPACVPALRLAAKDAEPTVAMQAKAVWRKVAPADLDPFTEAMIDLETEHSANAALGRLAAMKPIETQRETVVAALTPLLAGGKPVDVALVAAALVTWQGPDAVTTLLPLLSGSEPLDHRQKIAQSLAKTGDPRVATALVDWMTTGGDRVVAPPILASMGPAAEDATLTLLFVDDAQLAPVTVGLLEKVGTGKSIRPLRMFSTKVQNPALARQAEAAANTLEKRRQAELREQRLRPTPSATTTPAAKKPA